MPLQKSDAQKKDALMQQLNTYLIGDAIRQNGSTIRIVSKLIENEDDPDVQDVMVAARTYLRKANEELEKCQIKKSRLK
jgi:hypothetical protein